jgi:leucyl-tRNA synthetase
MVLAPEHPLVESLTKPKQKKQVERYRESTEKQDLVTRKTSTDKTGVFTGSYATNPATEKEIPIWISDYVLMEYGTGAIMGVPGHDERDFEFATKFELPIVRVVCGEREDANTPLHKAFTECESGTLVNSGVFDGFRVEAAKKAIVELLAKGGSAKPVVHYRLHDWCISRQRYWGPPIPIIYCESCGTVPVPEKDLPVLLPFIEDFKPDDSGVSPLARHEEWYRVECPKCGKPGRRETDVSDNFLDNSWYFLRYPSVGNDDVPFEKNVTKKWLPVNSYIGGNEHAVLHLLYSRFITMVLHDAGHLAFEEPFTRFRAHGHIIREGAKMSKTQGNIVNPDEYIERWGADAFRTYLMFLGPYEQGGDFRDQSISGTRRFLDRLFASVQSMAGDGEADHAVMRKLHQTIRKVGEDIARLSYNTAVAAMMEYMNVLRKGERTPHRDEVLRLIPLVSPFAPHIAEELWEQTGGTGSVFDSAWPSFDPRLALEDSIELVVQVNGKVRGKITVARDISEQEALVVALADPTVSRFTTGDPRKVIFVPGRLLNIVVD